MKLSNDFLLREIAGENILVYIGSDSRKATSLFTLNETGNFIISNMDKCSSVNEFVQCLTDEYEIDENSVLADVTEFIEKLRSIDALIEG